jgi:glyoxylase-like metal-dependent hydrolase (beta-lactamase superfamily II)
MRPWRKITAIVVGVIIISVLVVCAAIAMVIAGRQVVADGLEYNGVRIVKDGVVSLAVVRSGNGKVVLIDAGYDKTGKAILDELARRHLTRDAVAAILLTHSHTDHISGLDLFPHAQVMALETELPLLEGRASWRGPLMHLFPRLSATRVSRILHDGETVTMAEFSARVFAVPGHTPGSAAYLVNDSVLFLGDAADISNDGKIQDPPWITSDDQGEARNALVRLDRRLIQEGADVKMIACSHSGVLAEGLAPLNAFAQSVGAR